MGELIRPTFQQHFEKPPFPQVYNSLALSEPPEQPQRGRRKRHLTLVEEVGIDSKMPEPRVSQQRLFEGNPVSYDLDRRRQLKQAGEPRRQAFDVPASRSQLSKKQVVFSVVEGKKPETEKPVTKESQLEEYFYTKEWVQQEVAKVKRQPRKFGETPWWHLKGTGFWIPEQISQLIRNTKQAGKEAFPDVLALELAKIRTDKKHFEREYINQLASLTFDLDWQMRDGEWRIVCPEYKGKGKDTHGALWSSVTSKDEREGVVYETLFGNKEKGITGVEGELRDAAPGTMVAVFSPAGWSGYRDLSYPEAQYYVIQVQQDRSLKAFTFRSDATIMQVEALQRSLGLSIPETTDQKQRIKNTIANVAYLTPAEADHAQKEGRKPIRTFEDFIDRMQESVDGKDVAYGEGGGVKTYDEIRAFVKEPEKFFHEHPLGETLHKRFSEYATWRFSQGGSWDEIELDLQIALAFDPLHLNKAYRMEGRNNGDRKRIAGGEEMNIYDNLASGTDYENETKKLQELPGCAGGGKSRTYTSSLGSARVTELGGFGGGDEYEFNEYGDCVVCHDGPKSLGPCKICIHCDAKMGGKGAQLLSVANAEGKNEQSDAQVYSLADYAKNEVNSSLPKAS